MIIMNILNMKRLVSALISFAALLGTPSYVFAQGEVSLSIPTPALLKITDLGKFISAILAAILVIATLASFIYLLLGGLSWITSGGDKAAVEGAQKRIQAAIIGLFIVFAAWALMIVIGKFLGIPNVFDLAIPP